MFLVCDVGMFLYYYHGLFIKTLSRVLRLLRYLTVLRTGTLHTAVDLFGQSYTSVSKDVTVIGKAFARCFYAKYIRPITPYSPEWAYHRTSQDSAFMYILV